MKNKIFIAIDTKSIKKADKIIETSKIKNLKIFQVLDLIKLRMDFKMNLRKIN